MSVAELSSVLSSVTQQANSKASKEEQIHSIMMDPTLHFAEQLQKVKDLNGGKLDEWSYLQIQNGSQERSRLMSMITNALQTAHQTMMSVISNMR